jgi:hypothetical protein
MPKENKKRFHKIIFIPLLICFLTYVVSSYSQIRIVLTAALTDSYFEARKQQYTESLRVLTGYGYTNVYIIEALKKQAPTFLDEYSSNVFYASVNNPDLDHRNLGINEAKTLLEGLKYFNFYPDDIIIKMNGRSQLISDNLIKVARDNPTYDVFVRWSEGGGVFTLGYAIKCKYLIDWLENINYDVMASNFTTLEEEFFKYLNTKNLDGQLKLFLLDTLGMKYNYLGSSTLPGHEEEVRYF